jgi:thiosulfate dehydrogenase
MFGAQSRAVVVEKVRHGKFFNLAGVMPFYAAETLSDAELADILAYLGL